MVVRSSCSPWLPASAILPMLLFLLSPQPVVGQGSLSDTDQLAVSFAGEDPYWSSTNDFGGAFANSIEREAGYRRLMTSRSPSATSSGSRPQEQSRTSTILSAVGVLLVVGLASGGGAIWWRRHSRRKRRLKQKGPHINLLGRAAR